MNGHIDAVVMVCAILRAKFILSVGKRKNYERIGHVLTKVKCFSRSSDILSGLAEDTETAREELDKM